MQRKPKSRSAQIQLALVSALASVFSVATIALGQQRIDTSVRTDANPMLGSSGQNYQTPGFGANYRAAIQNVGNTSVGNGFAFRGTEVNGVNLGTGITDPFAFRGLLAGQGIDQFIANSTGVPTESNPFASSGRITNAIRPIYGGANTVVAPPGFTQASNSRSYVPAKPDSPSPSDTRIGVIDYNYDPTAIPTPDQGAAGGQVNPQINASPSQFWNASPLMGVQPWNATPGQSDQPQGQDLFGGQAGSNNYSMNAGRIADLRSQFSKGIGARPGQPLSQGMALQPLRPSDMTKSNSLTGVGAGGLNLSSQMTSSGMGSSGQGTTYGAQPIADPSLTPAPGDVSTMQSDRPQLPDNFNLPQPGQQSAQYSLLQQRINDYKKSAPKTDEEANRRFQAILRLRKQIEGNRALANPANLKPGELNPGMTGRINGVNPETDAVPTPVPLPSNPNSVNITIPPPTASPSGAVAPLQIDSYANGIASKDFADLINLGEAAVKKGQYDKGINLFDQAVAVVPNNSMFVVARANAELGGGYYNKADGDLHDAYIGDDTMLMSQYDLIKHMSEQRVQTMVDDLKHIADDSPQNETPAFLLAYIMYNTNRPAEAARWLNEADKRSGGNDPVIEKMKRLWVFQSPATPGAAPSPATHPSEVAPGKN